MAPPPVLYLKDVHLTFGATPLLMSAGFTVGEGDRIALVGRNGSGKSTLLKIAAGLVEMDKGERFVQPGKTIRYLPQEPDLTGFTSIRDYVIAGLDSDEGAYRAEPLFNALQLSGDEDPAKLSGGEARRAALARVLVAKPDILLLDEPTNHLDLPAIEWLEETLQGMSCALVLISHDRRFLENLSRRTVWLDRGVTRNLDKGFSSFEAWRDAFFEEEERTLAKLGRKIAEEEHWMRYGVTARRKRNMRRVAVLADLRKQKRAHRGPQGLVKLTASEAETSSHLLIEARNISKTYEDRPIVTNFSIRIMRGDRLGIVGENGAGKTTLLRLLTGDLSPDSGSVRLGAAVALEILDQRRATLDPTATLAATLTDGKGDFVTVGASHRHVIGYMKDFLFSPEQAKTPLAALSGGERGRVMLARALARPSNLLVLDEPTNDLDLETLDLLEDLLSSYTGTVIVVSHDRDFLDRIATSVVVAEGDGLWREYAGGYSDMVAQRGYGIETHKNIAPEKPRPHSRPEPTGTVKPGRIKLSFKEMHALKTLPLEIERLTKRVAKLKEQLADPSFYAKDPHAFTMAAEELEKNVAALEAAEEEWLRLELLREDG